MPVDIKHPSFKSLSGFLRTAEKGGLLKLKDVRPDAVVVAVYPTHVDVVAHRLHRTAGEEESRRRRAEEREAQQAAATANAGKCMKCDGVYGGRISALYRSSKTSGTSKFTLIFHLRPLVSTNQNYDSTSDLYTHAEVKSALLAYVAKHELVNRVEQQYLNVSADAVFSVVLYGSPNAKGSVPVPEFAKREDALSALCGRMQPWYRIAIGSDEPFTKKGAPYYRGHQDKAGTQGVHIVI